MTDKDKRMELPKISLDDLFTTQTERDAEEYVIPIPLSEIDDLFTTQEERDNKNMEKIIEIPIKEITDFQNHPYKVIDNEQMKELSESIKENGLFMPVIVRPKKNGRI